MNEQTSTTVTEEVVELTLSIPAGLTRAQALFLVQEALDRGSETEDWPEDFCAWVD